MNRHLHLIGLTFLLSSSLPVAYGEDSASDGSNTGAGAPPAVIQHPASSEDAVIELDWDALIPADWQPGKLLEDFNADQLNDEDPRAKELMDKLQALWKTAPVVPELNGKRVKLPGFMVPLEMEAEQVSEFLLVPYYGACIHVPPPPANQTVHVVMAEGKTYRGGYFDTLWVTGTLKVEVYSSDLADAGYRLEASKVEPYEGKSPP